MNQPTMGQQQGASPRHIRIYTAMETVGSKQHVPASSSVCTMCGGAGRLRVTVPYGDPAFGISTPCKCSEARHTAQRLQQRRHAAHLDAFPQHTFTTFNAKLPGVQEAFRASTAFAANPQGWLLLLGPCGCGKTHLSAALANQRLESGASVYFTTAPDLLDALRATMSSPQRYKQLFALVREVGLLVLDDFGAQQSSPWSNEKFLQILEARANATLPTVITAIPREFQRLDERLRSRLSDAQLVTTVLFEHATDFRPHKPATGRRT